MSGLTEARPDRCPWTDVVHGSGAFTSLCRDPLRREFLDVAVTARSETLFRPTSMGPSGIAFAIAAIGFATIAGAWAFQAAGYAPCELCLKERIPYYGGIPLALVTGFLALRRRGSLLPAGFAALTLVFGAVMAGYHAGVEWHFWPGPASCTGAVIAPAKVEDFLHQLQTASVVRCDAAALRIAGLSLAGWDAAVSALLAGLAGLGFVRSQRASIGTR